MNPNLSKYINVQLPKSESTHRRLNFSRYCSMEVEKVSRPYKIASSLLFLSLPPAGASEAKKFYLKSPAERF